MIRDEGEGVKVVREKWWGRKVRSMKKGQRQTMGEKVSEGKWE